MTKIILDADVIIHFAKGELLGILPTIFKNYDHVVLDTVYKEINEPLKSQLDQQIHLLKNIQIVEFKPTGNLMREYALLSANFGRGESACMAYCKYNRDVIGSSNLRDIKDYCDKHSIVYLTTLDFIYHAFIKKIITADEANDFIVKVRRQGSKLPDVDILTYVSSVKL